MSLFMPIIKLPHKIKKPHIKTQQSNRAGIYLVNGLGDKLLDLIGFVVLCKYLKYTPQITFERRYKFAWGQNNIYDNRLFEFSEFVISNHPTPFYMEQRVQSVSLCPYNVFDFVSKIYPTITFEKISQDFITYSKQIIKPSSIILSNIPDGLENAYGIHLRKSDKIINGKYKSYNIQHQSTLSDFEMITSKLLEDVKQIIIHENEPTFLIVSEDTAWKKEISDLVLSFGNGKTIRLINIEYNNPNNYSNYNSVLDMFCLSKCKEILQGVKYSTFSTIASLIGNRKLRNYSHHISNYDICSIRGWSSVLSINNQPCNFNKQIHQHATKQGLPLKTNITKPFNMI